MSKGDVPHCTVCIVVCAIVCHTLVLIGNMQTAQSLAAMGDSSAGWSDVGVSLAGSLNNEMDHLMHATVTQLTGALDAIISVETDIDYVLGAAAKATDNHLSAMQKSEQDTEAGEVEKKVAPHDNEDDDWSPEAELTSLIQSSTDLDCENGSCGAGGDQELASLLQAKVYMMTPRSHFSDSDGSKHDMQNATVSEKHGRLHRQIKRLVAKISAGVHKLLELIKPALLQIGKWLQTMGPKMQGTIEEMSLVIDRVQKIIDQVMEKISGNGGHSEAMLEQVFELFDVSGTGFVNQGDVHKVSILYGITALQHGKGADLLKKYDASGDGKLTKKEFDLMLHDDSIPKASTNVLRAYSRRLAEIAGKVAKATMRDDVAHSVVQYVTLVCAKSRTKTSWVAQALTNGSLPMEFVADVLKQFAHNAENPGIVDVMDVGAIAVKEMWHLNSKAVTKALKLMADPKWWKSAGFDPSVQAKRVKKVSEWVVAAGGQAVKPVLLQVVDSTDAGDVSTALHNSVLMSSRKFASMQLEEKAAEIEVLLSSETSAALFEHVLGSAALVRAGTDPDVARVVSGGVHAQPQTLKFKDWLATNASTTAHTLNDLCFDHSHSSSGPMDSMATQIKGMLSKTQNFLRLMQRYSTPDGINALERRFEKFVDHAATEVLDFVDKKIEAEAAKLGIDSMLPGKSSLVEMGEDIPIQGMWKEVIKFTKDMKATLPTVIDDIKFAKREVSAVSSNMMNIFPAIKTKATPIFTTVESLYKIMWISYYIVFMVLTMGVLYYGFWAHGYWGGAEAISEEEDAKPLSFKDRLCNSLTCCVRACGACLDRCESSSICFWSMLLLAQVIVLVMFVLSIVLTITAGLKAFMSAGCGEVYLLNDNIICKEIMKGIQYWLTSFWSSESTPLESMCVSRTLMTCGVISSKLKMSAICTSAGSMLATILTAQMIFESARLHEKARWRRMTEEKTLEFKDVDPGEY